MPKRLVFRTVACSVIPQTLRLGGIDDHSINAAPTTTTWTMLERLIFALIASRIMLQALRLGGVDDHSIDATPTTIRRRWRTMLKRLVFGRVASTNAVLRALVRGGQDDSTAFFQAAPTLRRRRRRRRRIIGRWRRGWRWHIGWRWRRRRRRTYRWRTSGTTGKWPRPTRRWLGRTRRVFAWRSTPFVTTAIRLPAPAPSVLFPNPLATVIVPLPTSDLERRQFESVLIAIGGDSIADDDAGITDCPRDRQNFETALGKIAERVEVVHFVDIKKSVFGIIGGHG